METWDGFSINSFPRFIKISRLSYDFSNSWPVIVEAGRFLVSPERLGKCHAVTSVTTSSDPRERCLPWALLILQTFKWRCQISWNIMTSIILNHNHIMIFSYDMSYNPWDVRKGSKHYKTSGAMERISDPTAWKLSLDGGLALHADSPWPLQSRKLTKDPLHLVCGFSSPKKRCTVNYKRSTKKKRKPWP